MINVDNTNYIKSQYLLLTVLTNISKIINYVCHISRERIDVYHVTIRLWIPNVIALYPVYMSSAELIFFFFFPFLPVTKLIYVLNTEFLKAVVIGKPCMTYKVKIFKIRI